MPIASFVRTAESLISLPAAGIVRTIGLAEDAIHSPNERYGLEQFDRGVETIPLFCRSLRVKHVGDSD